LGDGKPSSPPQRRHDLREGCNALRRIIHTGAPWNDLPERYGPWRTVYARIVLWRRDGTWERLLA
jgi:transposase